METFETTDLPTYDCLVAPNCRFREIPATVSRRLLPRHAARLGDGLDVTIALVLRIGILRARHSRCAWGNGDVELPIGPMACDSLIGRLEPEFTDLPDTLLNVGRWVVSVDLPTKRGERNGEGIQDSFRRGGWPFRLGRGGQRGFRYRQGSGQKAGRRSRGAGRWDNRDRL
jgi:hypothetical protein